MKKIFIITLFFLCNKITNAQNFDNSNLPIVIITTDFYPGTNTHQEIPDDPKIGASMKIIYRPDGSRNFLNDQDNPLFLNYNGRIKIEIRGSTSQMLDKKPYSLTTVKSDNISNNNVSILGMPKENDWILNSFAWDPTFTKDFLAYSLSRRLGNYASRGKYCEVIINNEYKGLYMLSEKIKIDENRVNIVKLNKDNNDENTITGGYITKSDKTTGGDPIAWWEENRINTWVEYIHENPKPEDITPEQNDYIFSKFSSLTHTTSRNNSDINNGYPSIIDIPSFIDFMLINEIMGNVDAYQFSTFFHKDRNGKLRAGPVWDFNLSCGTDVFGDRSTYYDFQFDNGDNVGSDFWKNLFDDQNFYCQFYKRWLQTTGNNNPLNIDKIYSIIDSLSAVLNEAKLRDDQKWNSIGIYHNQIEDNSVLNLKSWLNLRMRWLNTNLKPPKCNLPILAPIVITKINYNPKSNGIYKSNDLEFIELTNNGDLTVDISGYYFKNLGFSYVFPPNSIFQPGEKIYLSSNLNAFIDVYKIIPNGQYARNLSNSSFELILVDAFGSTVDSVNYKNSYPWPIIESVDSKMLNLKDINCDNAMSECWDLVQVDVITSRNEIQNNIHIYPNPASNYTTIKSSNLISGYEIYDELGRLVFKESNVNSQNFTINLSAFTSGLYLVKAETSSGKTIFFKLLKK